MVKERDRIELDQWGFDRIERGGRKMKGRAGTKGEAREGTRLKSIGKEEGS